MRGQLIWIGIEKKVEEKRKGYKKKKPGNSSSKIEYRNTRTMIASASSLAPKIGGSAIVNADRACTNKESKEDECSHDLYHNAINMLWR